jgi:hypothetical protein
MGAESLSPVGGNQASRQPTSPQFLFPSRQQVYADKASFLSVAIAAAPAKKIKK